MGTRVTTDAVPAVVTTLIPRRSAGTSATMSNIS